MCIENRLLWAHSVHLRIVVRCSGFDAEQAGHSVASMFGNGIVLEMAETIRTELALQREILRAER